MNVEKKKSINHGKDTFFFSFSHWYLTGKKVVLAEYEFKSIISHLIFRTKSKLCNENMC